MPFDCKFQLNNGAVNASDSIIFLKFFDDSFGHYHSVPIAIAEINFNGNQAYIFSNCPCFPSTKGNLKVGDKINSETIIGYFSADGEDIPYFKQYAVIIENQYT